MDFLTNFHPTTTTGLHLTVNYYCERSKANFDRLSAAALTTKKINCPKYQSGNIKQNSAVCVGERVLLNIKISRQKRRCRSKPPRQSDVRDDKNVCCLSSLIVVMSPTSFPGSTPLSRWRLREDSGTHRYTPALFPDVSLFFEEQERAQRTKGRGKGERRLGDLVFKMAESAMADDYAIFQSEFRPVHSAYLEQKIACPDPLCKEKPVFCQKNGLQHHYRRRHPEVRFLPKVSPLSFLLPVIPRMLIPSFPCF